jgi:hypothetical protein
MSAMPKKPKRVSPPEPAYQLLIGRPSEKLVDFVWRSAFQGPDSLVPYSFHWEAVSFIRRVCLAVQEFVRDYRHHPEPISFIRDDQGRTGLSARPACKGFLELFLEPAPRKIAAITRHLPGHKLHPLFKIYEATARQNQTHNGRDYIELAVDCLFFHLGRPTPDFRSQSEMLFFRDRLNSLFKTLYEEARKLSESVKSFSRTARETRHSLMQYAEHFISRAPKLYIAHLAIYRPSYSPRRTPVPHHEICDLRNRFIKMIKAEMPESIYLGYSILLRHNAQIGFWLDAFVFLRDDDVLRVAATSTGNFLYSWRTLVSEDHAVCIGRWWSASQGYEEALAEITMATEFDFYCRVIPPNQDHGFWCSQSPVGKLAKRTRIRKRCAARAADKRQQPVSDPLLSLFQQERQQELAELKLASWEQGVQRHNRSLSKKRTAAAKNRRIKERGNSE